LGPDAIGRLGCFLRLLQKWNRRINVVSARDSSRLLTKHTIDSLAPVPHLPGAGRVIDLGSGAGFPGIVIACVRPDLHVVLVEARRRRTSFLREVIRAAGLQHASAPGIRAEDLAGDPVIRGSAAVVVGRGLRLDAFLALGSPFLEAGGRMIAMQASARLDIIRTLAASHRLRLESVSHYRLPEGEDRVLVIFGPSNEEGTPVSSLR
jgi:16S rRNA (guanine527-N7)-methyltransferase